MKQSEFMNIFTDELKKHKVAEIEEIISDFEDHFTYKLEEGYSEEEIVKKIGDPIHLAEDYITHDHPDTKSGNAVKWIGMVALDIFVVPMYLTLWLSVLVLPIFALTLLVLGFLLITSLNIAGLVPSMPYISSLLIGVSVLSLALSSGVGSIYVYQYVKQWTKVYMKWHKNVTQNTFSPSMSKHPKLAKRLQSKLKLINMIAILVCLSVFIVGFAVSAILAGSWGFWHVWGWFV